MYKEAIAAERHWVMKTAVWNQPIYFKNVLTSEWKSENMLCWGRNYVSLQLIKIRFDGGRPIKTSSPVDPAFLNASVTLSSKFCIQNNFKAASLDGPISQTIDSRL